MNKDIQITHYINFQGLEKKSKGVGVVAIVIPNTARMLIIFNINRINELGSLLYIITRQICHGTGWEIHIPIPVLDVEIISSLLRFTSRCHREKISNKITGLRPLHFLHSALQPPICLSNDHAPVCMPKGAAYAECSNQ